MAITKSVKQEIIKKNPFKKETLCLLQGLFLSCGDLIISNKSLSFSLSNEMQEVMLFAKSKLEELFSGVQVDIVQIVKNFKNKERFELSVSGDYNRQVLEKLGIVCFDGDESVKILECADKSYMQNKEKMMAFFAGVFLGSGSLSVPCETKQTKRYGYHFEVSITNKAQADIIAEILSNFDIFPKTIERNDVYVIYLKNSDIICDVLGLLGASKTVLDLLNERVSRDVSNNTNRQINCISANIDKAVNAGLKQLRSIEIIQSTIGLENLPDTLCETALLRLANPEASLKDLLELMDEKISKGALAQRFEKINRMAEELGENNG